MFFNFAFKNIEKKCVGKCSETNECEGKLYMVYPDGFISGIYMCDKCRKLILPSYDKVLMYVEGIDF
jgi:hypothetical protein